MGKRVLLVEDDWKLRRISKDFLVRDGYTVMEAADGEAALEIYNKEKVDIVILDIMMPKLNGWEVCEEIRFTNKDVPIIMLTAKGQEDDILKGYELETDEYITKPVSMKVLLAKVKALLRKEKVVEKINIGELEIDVEKQVAKVAGENLDLSAKEYELLYYMACNQGIILSREKMIIELWGYDYDGDSRAVDSQMKRLRKKVGEGYIHTIRGMGYKLEVKQ